MNRRVAGGPRARTPVALALLFLALAAATSVAQVPTKMNYQLMLTDDADQPLAEQTVEVVLSLYTDESAGSLVWTETRSVTTNSIGVASVIMGESTPLVAGDFAQPLWLQVEVEGEVLSPRRELVSAPYAFTAADSDSLGGIAADDYAMDSDLSGFGDGHSLDADDGDPVDQVYVDDDGVVGIGSGSVSGTLEFTQVGAASPVVTVGSYLSAGGHLRLRNSSGEDIGFFGPAYSKGYLTVEGANGHFIVSGTDMLTWDTAMYLSGGSSSMAFYTGLSGDSSVDLPNGAVSATEILDEPGVASVDSTSSVDLTGDDDVLLSATISAPGPGYILAIATAWISCAGGTPADGAYFGVSDVTYSIPYGARSYVEVPNNSGTGSWHLPLSVQGLFEADPFTPDTIYFLGNELLGNWTVYDRKLTLVYLPTAYGAVARTCADGPRTDISSAPLSSGAGHPPMTAADIAAERSRSIAANQARIEAELAAMRAEVEELRARLNEERPLRD